MKSLYRIWAPAAVALVAAVAVHAYPTVMPGPTGAVMLPTADVADSGQLIVAGAAWDTVNNQTFPVRAVVGIGNLEIGGVYAFNQTSDIWGLNAKLSAPGAGGRTALGGVYLEANDVNTTVNQVYLTHTRTLIGAGQDDQLRGTVGVNWTRIDQTIFENEAFRAYGALEFIAGGRWSILAETQARQPELGDTQNLFSAAVRYPIDSPVVVEVGISNATPLGVQAQRPTRWFAGIGLQTQ